MNDAPTALDLPLTTSAASLNAFETSLNRRWLVMLTLGALILIPRLGVFFLNENLYGDAVARTELAMRWAESPHWISSFGDGSMQFGPLHIYAVGLFLKLGFSPENAGRWLSLIFGVLGVFPLVSLTRRYFGETAAHWAAFGYAFWGLHVQISTTAASEALSLFLLLCALQQFAAAFDDNAIGPLLGSAILMNAACAIRYDNWLLVPVLCGLLWFRKQSVVSRLVMVIVFVFVCAPFPLIWMHGNELAHGSPLYPIEDIEKFHQGMVAGDVVKWGSWGFRGVSLLFWPVTALLTLSPLLAGWGMLGMRRAFVEQPRLRWLMVVALAPVAYFTLRSVVWGNFAPLARFTVNQVALLLPFVGLGFHAWTQGLKSSSRRLWAALAVSMAVGWPIVLGVLTYKQEGRVQNSLRPISPVSTNSPVLMSWAQKIGQKFGSTDSVLVLDEHPRFEDMQLAFFSGLRESQLVRVRWGNLESRLARSSPSHLILMPGGLLGKNVALQWLDAQNVRLGALRFREIESEAGYSLFQRVEER